MLSRRPVARTVSCTCSHAFSFNWPVAFRGLTCPSTRRYAPTAGKHTHTVQRPAHDMMSRRELRWSSSYLAKRTCTLGGGQTDGCAARSFTSWPLGADERLNAPRSQSHVGPKGEKGKRVGKVEKALEHSKNRLSMGGPETPRPHGQVQVAIRASLGPGSRGRRGQGKEKCHCASVQERSNPTRRRAHARPRLGDNKRLRLRGAERDMIFRSHKVDCVFACGGLAPSLAKLGTSADP